MNKAIILDLDNCIADDEWRHKYIDWNTNDLDRRYHHYHQLCGFDYRDNDDLILGTEDIIIFTARPITVREITMEWLDRQGVTPAAILMRNVGDHTPSVALKEKQLGWLFQYYGYEKHDIVRAYDDRQDIVDMYESLGIPATRRFIHDKCAVTPPTSRR